VALPALDPLLLAGVVGASVVVLLAVGLLIRRRRRRRSLRRAHGRAYEENGTRNGSRPAADLQPTGREQRRAGFAVHPVPAGERELLRGRFQHVQASFVDDPDAAIERADELVCAAAWRRGYPDEGREQLLADLSVDHPAEVEAYRRALRVRRTALGRSGRRRAHRTEELRGSLLVARQLFGALLQDTEDDPLASPTEFFRSIEDDATGRR
jgi:hypothetical protein